MKKKFIVCGLVFLAVLIFVMSPLAPYVRSLAVMKVYSYMNEKESLMREKAIDIEIPGGGATEEDDWYPFVMTYNADSEFRQFTGKSGARLTIMYNFPAFDMWKGCSRLYDDESPYYNGFYGAYMVEGKLGFSEGGELDGSEACGSLEFDEREAAIVPEFDMKKLVLEDLGMDRSDIVFEWQTTDVKNNLSYAGYDGWTRVDADMTVSGTLHRPVENYRNYIQYGKPAYEVSADDEFAPVPMKGRLYARYFAEEDVSIYFYVMARNLEVVEACDERILSGSAINVE